MTPEQIQLIKLSFVPLMGRKLEAGRLFYDKLFEIAPETRSMFAVDVNSQSEKLMNMLGMVISSLHDAPNLDTILADLGRRHAAYKVQDGHYDLVSTALMSMLERILGEGFTDQARAAWGELYDSIAATMRGSAAQPVSPQRPIRRLAGQ